MEKLKERYSFLDSSILIHGMNYFKTASKLYETFEPENLYPILSLLGFSAELFLKAFDINPREEYVDIDERTRSLVKKTVKTKNKNGHNLEKLLNHYLVQDKELFDYLITEYKTRTDRDLQIDIANYSKIFEDSRYIFESNEMKYLNDIDVIFDLVSTFYDSIFGLYES